MIYDHYLRYIQGISCVAELLVLVMLVLPVERCRTKLQRCTRGRCSDGHSPIVLVCHGHTRKNASQLRFSLLPISDLSVKSLTNRWHQPEGNSRNDSPFPCDGNVCIFRSPIGIAAGTSGGFLTEIACVYGTALIGIPFIGTSFTGVSCDIGDTVCSFNGSLQPDRHEDIASLDLEQNL